MSVISWLALQNGDQNDPDAYYYGAESPTDGVRLTGPKVGSVAIAIDTVLWDSPNANNLPGDAHDPAQSDEFIPYVQAIGVAPKRYIRDAPTSRDVNTSKNPSHKAGQSGLKTPPTVSGNRGCSRGR